MLNQQYYHGVIRKCAIAFGNLFNDIIIQRLNNSGSRVQSVLVPISYGPKQKWLVRLREDPNLEKDVAITLPRMGFEIQSFAYDSQRKVSSTNKLVSVSPSDPNKLLSQYAPVPYNITVTLSIFVENTDDGNQILEQILPYFRPEFTTNINMIPELNLSLDVPVILQDVSVEDAYEGDFQTRRALIYTLSFVMKTYIYGPIETRGVIKRAIINIFDGVDNTATKIEKLTLTPAQYANGTPLFVPSGNSALSVAINQISANTDYGYSLDVNTNPYDLR